MEGLSVYFIDLVHTLIRIIFAYHLPMVSGTEGAGLWLAWSQL